MRVGFATHRIAGRESAFSCFLFSHGKHCSSRDSFDAEFAVDNRIRSSRRGKDAAERGSGGLDDLKSRRSLDDGMGQEPQCVGLFGSSLRFERALPGLPRDGADDRSRDQQECPRPDLARVVYSQGEVRLREEEVEPNKLATMAARDGPHPNIAPAMTTGRTKISVSPEAGTTWLAMKARNAASPTRTNVIAYCARTGIAAPASKPEFADPAIRDGPSNVAFAMVRSKCCFNWLEEGCSLFAVIFITAECVRPRTAALIHEIELAARSLQPQCKSPPARRRTLRQGQAAVRMKPEAHERQRRFQRHGLGFTGEQEPSSVRASAAIALARNHGCGMPPVDRLRPRARRWLAVIDPAPPAR